MIEYKLPVHKREVSKNFSRDLREKRQVLGIVYGKKVPSVPVSIDSSDILRIYRKAGTSAIINLDLNGKDIPVIIKELTLHPVRNTILHVDFYAVDMNVKTVVVVPIKFIGVSPAVKDLDGILTVAYDSLEIRCLPSEILSEIEVDISILATLHDHITVSDLKLDTSKYEIMHLDPETVICSVVAKKEEIEEEEADAESEEIEGEEGEEVKEGDAETETKNSSEPANDKEKNKSE